LLRAELLERSGQYQTASESIEAALKHPEISGADQSRCHLTLGRIAAANGDFEAAAAELQRSTSVALFSRDFEHAAWSQLRLLIMLFDASGPEAVGPLLSQVRGTAARSGDARVLAALHVHVAEMESKRGLLSSAERQIKLALRILEGAPNTWLLAMAEQNRANLSCLKLDFQAGIEHAERACNLSARSGWAVGSATSSATLGNLLLYTGRFEEAASCCFRALDSMSEGSDNFSGTLETLARIRLLQGRIGECEDILRRIDGYSAFREDARRRFVYRHTLLTRARALHFKGDLNQASDILSEATRLAIETRDDWLLSCARLMKAQLLAEAHGPGSLIAIFDSLTRQIASHPLDRHAAMEHAFASGLMAVGDSALAREHVLRARKIYEAVNHRLGLLELTICPSLSRLGDSLPLAETTNGQATTKRMLQDIASVISHANRPRLIGRELFDLVVASGSVVSARAVARRRDGTEELLAEYREEVIGDDALERAFLVGAEQGTQIELILRPRPDIESFAVLKALTTIISTLHDLERARADREERATIWPADEVVVEGDTSVITGHMRETMLLAQKVARTTVSVLITGESGTGKEIIARAIHACSARAQKPFVAFNCAAIPRDLVESQLFGHRRGAFTGADRDYLGVIRGARDGTLFLDEIGDPSLELQPKLLRFLESGEIAPLGDPATHRVNVRIVAATNANLDEAVRDGRFREDLFYRLNVVPLSLKPLRERRDEIPALVNTFVERAAKEFNKGRLEVAEETIERLLLYRWPGNVRQLHNEVRRIVALAEPNSTLEPELISRDIIEAMPIFRQDPASRRELAVRLTDKLTPTLLRVECEMIKAALRDNQGRVDAVAKALGISRKGLYLKRQRLGL
jgi:DNA-binding NtrC family response regulator/tetratricopeptide (TPR) repeat protein